MTTEEPVSFLCVGERLHGVWHQPPDSPGVKRRLAVLLLHGWSGTRLGPHRMLVEMARALAARGFHALRFDFRGRGESEGDAEKASLTTMIQDARAAGDFLLARSGARSLALLGLCSGGEVAVGSAAHPAVRALALWSVPLVGPGARAQEGARSAATVLTTYLRKLRDPATWRKILKGEVHGKLVAQALSGGAGRNLEAARRDEQRALTQSLHAFRGATLFVHGGADPGAGHIQESYQKICKENGIGARFHTLAGANHNFYSLAWKRELMATTLSWLEDTDGDGS